MCRILKVHHSGFYTWLKEPLSNKTRDDNRLIVLLKQAWLESGCVYGYLKLHDDLRSLGETCSLNKVARLTSLAGIKAQIGYKRKAGFYGGKPAVVAPNHLAQVFTVKAPAQAWVKDITYIRTHEGWLYLVVVIDLYSRRIIGWSMQSRMQMDLVLSALLMAVWRRKLKSKVIIHSDQGSQFTSHEWQKFLTVNNLEASMSLLDCFKDILVEPFMADRSVVTFDIGVLLWLSRLDILDVNAHLFSPCHEFTADIFWPIVHSNNLRLAPPFDNPLQTAHHPIGR